MWKKRSWKERKRERERPTQELLLGIFNNLHGNLVGQRKGKKFTWVIISFHLLPNSYYGLGFFFKIILK
jgi:hypothetical protein